MSESNWPVALQKAEQARKLLSDKRTLGEGMRLFDELAREYPRDGMVYFKRAEAWEALQDLEKASLSYKRAQECFPKQLWKELARTRADRLDSEIQSLKLKQRVRQALGRAGKELSPIEESAWLAGMFAGKSPFVSIELSRTALVRAIKELEDKHRVNRVDRADASWSQRLDTLNRFLSNPLLQQAKRVLSKRRRAV
jgi:tetratricopeptide (TPR) repeat protein